MFDESTTPLDVNLAAKELHNNLLWKMHLEVLDAAITEYGSVRWCVLNNVSLELADKMLVILKRLRSSAENVTEYL